MIGRERLGRRKNDGYSVSEIHGRDLKKRLSSVVKER